MPGSDYNAFVRKIMVDKGLKRMAAMKYIKAHNLWAPSKAPAQRQVVYVRAGLTPAEKRKRAIQKEQKFEQGFEQHFGHLIH